MPRHSLPLRCIVFSYILALAAGCGAPKSAVQQIDQAAQDYRGRNYTAAVTLLDGFLADYPHSAEAPEAHYLRALCHAELGNRQRAMTDARQCMKQSKDPVLSAKARSTLATLLFEQRQYEEAIRYYSEALKGLPQQPPTDHARYNYALCLQRQGRWKDARLEFAAVYQRYPGSPLAERARLAYDWPHEHYAIQCGTFRQRKGADELSAKLSRAGLSPWTKPQSRSGETVYKVFVGRYRDHSQAVSALAQVKRKHAEAVIYP